MQTAIQPDSSINVDTQSQSKGEKEQEEIMFFGRKVESSITESATPATATQRNPPARKDPNKSNLTVVPRAQVSKLSGPAKEPSFNVKNLNDTNHGSQDDNYYKLVESRKGNLKLSEAKKRSAKKPVTSHYRERSPSEQPAVEGMVDFSTVAQSHTSGRMDTKNTSERNFNTIEPKSDAIESYSGMDKPSMGGRRKSSSLAPSVPEK